MKAQINDPELALRIQELIDISGNLNKLAKKSGLSSTTIKRYLLGTSDPSRMSLVALSKTTGIRMEWIATGKGLKYIDKASEDINNAVAEEHPPHYSVGMKPIPSDIEPVIEAFMEVMTSDVAGTKLALTQNTYEFRDKVRLHKEIAEIKDDMAAIKRRLFAEPREDDFKTQEAVGEKHRVGGE